MNNYGVWNMADEGFEDGASKLSYSNAMGLALFCVEEDDRGVRNFAVIEMDEDGDPIWHQMIWHGGFQGYPALYNECLRLGEISETADFADVSEEDY